MKRLVTALCLLGLAAGSAFATGPDVTTGYTPGNYTGNGQRDTCQWGFNDTSPGSGWTLGLGQQLGIMCPGPEHEITGVGGYFEFIVTPGTMNIVIYDNGVEVSRTPVQPVQGVNEFTITPVCVHGDACIMFCEVANFWAVTGEDYNSPPYGNSYYSTNCTCQNAFTDNNLTIWAHFNSCGPNPVQEMTWGKVRMMYH
jgi:hypothetical protein